MTTPEKFDVILVYSDLHWLIMAPVEPLEGYTNKRDLCEFCFETEVWRLLSNPVEALFFGEMAGWRFVGWPLEGCSRGGFRIVLYHRI